MKETPVKTETQASLQSIPTVGTTELPKRPKRDLGRAGSRLFIPPIPGYRVAIRKMTNSDGTPSPDVEDALAEGYTPIKASEVGFDKRLVSPFAPDANITFNLGRGATGLGMKIHQQWYEEIVQENIERNNSQVRLSSKEKDADHNKKADGFLTEGVLTTFRK